MPCNGKTELAKHRKNSIDCQQEYWDGINEKEICTNDGCGELFETSKDLEYHMRYHCGNEPNPYRPET